jgi:uncharacterized protein YjbI with pentapeptide repeats
MAERMTYEQSCAELQRQSWIDSTEFPKMPLRPPRYDDVEFGISFFRTRVEGAKFEGLTIPRTFVARSEIANSSFDNCDLSESVMNWNDFENVDFVSANLDGCDLRGCNFRQVNFTRARLRGSNLRHGSFDSCNFADADLTGAKLVRIPGKLPKLTIAQVAAVDWQIADGPEPEGG